MQILSRQPDTVEITEGVSLQRNNFNVVGFTKITSDPA